MHVRQLTRIILFSFATQLILKNNPFYFFGVLTIFESDYMIKYVKRTR
jgi:hypothetical protein